MNVPWQSKTSFCHRLSLLNTLRSSKMPTIEMVLPSATVLRYTPGRRPGLLIREGEAGYHTDPSVTEVIKERVKIVR